MDLKTLTREEFGEHENAVTSERERRNSIDNAPAQVAALAAAFVAGGGDVDELRAAVG